MFEALLARVAAWLRRRFARAQRTAALAEPVQDSLVTLLAAQADFLKQVQEQMAAQSRKHEEQMADLFRRVSAPTPLSWGQPAGLLRFGEDNAAQCASVTQLWVLRSTLTLKATDTTRVSVDGNVGHRGTLVSHGRGKARPRS